MTEVSSSVEGLEKGEDEIELSLELSIGRKSYTKPNPLPQKPMESSCYCPKMGALDCTQETQMGILPRSVNPKMDPAADPQSKREIQALRRQEARKKREEKLKGKAIPRGYVNDNVVLVEDEEPEPPRKKEKNEAFGVVANEEIMVKDLNDNGSNPRGKMQYPDRPELQYVRFTNGLVYPYGVMPGWGPVACGNEAPESEKRVRFEADTRRSFRPYNGNIINRNSLERNGNGSKDDEGENGNGKSYGSPGCNSDYQTSSRQGGHSSDTGSNSSKFSQEAMNISSAGNPPEEKSENKCDSKGTASNEVKDKSTTNHVAGIISSSIPWSIEAKCSEEPKSTTQQADPFNRPIATANDPTPPAPFKEETTHEAPIPQTESHVGPSLPQMPCVSTTGNGPNGKTITGFLYRYTKTEVSIVCVCHGTSFSPAEFVEHAGGVDIEHPLRHITVVPSAFS